MLGDLARGNSAALIGMMTSDSKRKRGRPPTTLKNMLTKDLRNIARITGIDWVNVLNEIRKMDKNTYLLSQLICDVYLLFQTHTQ